VITTDKIQYRFSAILKIIVWTTAVLNLLSKDYFFFGASLFVLFLTFIPAIVNRSFKITLPPEVDLITTVLLFLHYVLGEYNGFYVRFEWWDLFLHAFNSILLGTIGFVFVYALLATSRVTAKPFFIFLFSIFFTVFIGVIWELFEFSIDQAFGFNMQKSGLVDTMTDLIVDLFGAIAVAAVGFYYIKKREPTLIHNIIDRFNRR